MTRPNSFDWIAKITASLSIQAPCVSSDSRPVSPAAPSDSAASGSTTHGVANQDALDVGTEAWPVDDEDRLTCTTSHMNISTNCGLPIPGAYPTHLQRRQTQSVASVAAPSIDSAQRSDSAQASGHGAATGLMRVGLDTDWTSTIGQTSRVAIINDANALMLRAADCFKTVATQPNKMWSLFDDIRNYQFVEDKKWFLAQLPEQHVFDNFASRTIGHYRQGNRHVNPGPDLANLLSRSESAGINGSADDFVAEGRRTLQDRFAASYAAYVETQPMSTLSFTAWLEHIAMSAQEPCRSAYRSDANLLERARCHVLALVEHNDCIENPSASAGAIEDAPRVAALGDRAESLAALLAESQQDAESGSETACFASASGAID